jgi:hypothetical protein
LGLQRHAVAVEPGGAGADDAVDDRVLAVGGEVLDHAMR